MTSFYVGLGLVFLAGILQGSFVVPMTLTRHWKWEHTWAAFSLLGMLVFNWGIGLAVLPHLADALRDTPSTALYALIFLGACWGAGAILFGMGMERLGMAVGYPVIMGLILSLGALIPLAAPGAADLKSRPVLMLFAGTLVVLLGIVLCSRAAAAKEAGSRIAGASTTGTGLTIAVFAGILSCLPNVGLNYASALTASAVRHGAAPALAGNAAWVVQFTAGFGVNCVYCIFLIARRGNGSLFRREAPRNLGLVVAMAFAWIASFYLYGMGASHMGRWGAILGWPLFISLSILIGNLWGLSRGEWRSADPRARTSLNRGLAVVLVAVVLFGIGSAFK